MRRPADLGTVPPPEPDRDTAPFVLRARLWPDEWDRVCQAARTAGLPVKEWALRVLVGAAATSTYGGIVHAECRVDFYDGGDYWSLSGPLCRSQTMPGSFVVADKRHGGDYVFPMAGRDVEVYLPGEEDPIIQYRGLRCVRGVPS